MEPLLARFLRYIAQDTQCDPASEAWPSSEGQSHFIELLQEEIAAMGYSPWRDEAGYLHVDVPGSGTLRDAPAVGFLAHVDTASEAPGECLHPKIVEYTGEAIPLGESGLFLSEASFPELARLHGQRLVVTDGTTLLGADDKAGVAILVEALQRWHEEPTTANRRPVSLLFTMDEELGRGLDHFESSTFPVAFAYTIDGGALGELEWETFNASEAVINIAGRSVHPGYAKGKMRNALSLATRLDGMLPRWLRPEHREEREGFLHLTSFEGGIERVEMRYLLRDFSQEGLRGLEEMVRSACATLNAQEGVACITADIHEQYRNMAEVVSSDSDAVRLAREAIASLGIEPIERPVRGGTDGARLSFMGIPCPNLFTGGANFHGSYEYLHVEAQALALATVLAIATRP